MIDKVNDRLSLTDDNNIESVSTIVKPIDVITKYPIDNDTAKFIEESRKTIANIISGKDNRVMVVVGPCSIHNPDEAIEYAKKLKSIEKDYKNLFIIMRSYFEKPRTTVGWKGLTNDPDLDENCDIEKGLHIGRKLLLDISKLRLPVATELLDVMSPQYFGDLYSWAAVGARTTESQEHRKMASGIGAPVGFKNGTDGGIQVALDAIESSKEPHNFLSITKTGDIAYIKTKGNPNTHIVLRGGKGVTNYDKKNIDIIGKELKNKGIPSGIMVDVSHANSLKNYKNQPKVLDIVAKQIEEGNERIMGIMIESNINEGAQKHTPGKKLEHGKSITDECVSFETTIEMLDSLDYSTGKRIQKIKEEEFMGKQLKSLAI